MPTSPVQRLWLRQADAEFRLFRSLSGSGAADCHLLHHLQMATEKLGKAYLCRNGAAPSVHRAFEPFLRALRCRRSSDQRLIAKAFGFVRVDDLLAWLRSALPLASRLENMAPSLAGDGPNPEYPWPREAPQYCPAEHSFELWRELSSTGHGRRLLSAVQNAIHNFDAYG